ncbi:MAG: NAD/NADP octopine/nopaline dehydrogenase family protein [Chloroflexota bacterium]|nr:NAD/NADP octopine/nopaline dehydrogenase family protein [Chloroflexota bacterium]MED5450327.1 NAD/NADP octopine/nopaline dehydrogenase family protein [Chloroflexota bacterium]
MEGRKVTILGGGNTAFSVAARLSHMGNDICLLEHPDFAESISNISATKTIILEGVLETGPASIEKITLDPSEALEFSDLLLLIVPAYAHKPFAEFCGPYLTDDHTVVVMPGTLGSLEWKILASEFGANNMTVAEVDTAPYVCRKTSSNSAVIWGEVTALGLGVIPSSETSSVQEMLQPLFPGVTAYSDSLECGLSAMNPVVHPAGVLMNAGRVEYSRGDFYFYEEGVSSSVAKVIETVDVERRAIGTALGYELLPVAEGFHEAGFGPKGNLWEVINGSHMLTRLKAPGSLDTRWLSEDIPFGISAWSKIGKQYGISCPVMDSFVQIGNIVMNADGSEGRGPKDFGIENLSLTELKNYLLTGI